MGHTILDEQYTKIVTGPSVHKQNWIGVIKRNKSDYMATNRIYLSENKLTRSKEQRRQKIPREQ